MHVVTCKCRIRYVSRTKRLHTKNKNNYETKKTSTTIYQRLKRDMCKNQKSRFAYIHTLTYTCIFACMYMSYIHTITYTYLRACICKNTNTIYRYICKYIDIYVNLSIYAVAWVVQLIICNGKTIYIDTVNITERSTRKCAFQFPPHMHAA